MTDSNVVAFAAGPSQCGKTQALWDLMVSRHPRRLSWDFAGEAHKLNPAAVRVFSYDELREVLARLAARRSWHVALCLDAQLVPEVAPRVCRLLSPPITSADRLSFSRAVGGVCLDCSEADILAPNGSARPEVRALFQRGRHDWISLAMATQHPALVDRQVTNNAHVLLAFQSAEDVVLSYWKRSTSAAVAEMISELPQYHCAYIVRASQRVYVLDDERRTYRVLDFKGRDIPGDSHRPARLELSTRPA